MILLGKKDGRLWPETCFLRIRLNQPILVKRMQKMTEIKAKSKLFQGVEAQVGARRQAQSGPKTEAELMEQFGNLLDKIASHLASNPHAADKRQDLPPGLVSLAKGISPGRKAQKPKKAVAKEAAAPSVEEKSAVAKVEEKAPESQTNDGAAAEPEKDQEKVVSDDSSGQSQADPEQAAIEAEPEALPVELASTPDGAPSQAASTDSQINVEKEAFKILGDSKPVQGESSSDDSAAPVLLSEDAVDSSVEIPLGQAPGVEAVIEKTPLENAPKAPVSELPANPADLPEEGVQVPQSAKSAIADELLSMRMPEEARQDLQTLAAMQNQIDDQPSAALGNRVNPEQLMSLLIQQAAQRVLGAERGVDAPSFKAVELALKGLAVQGVSHAADGAQLQGREQADTSGLKRQDRGLGLEKEKLAKGLSRPSALRTMEKVEGALAEIARSKNGQSISLELDPQTLGKVRVGVSLKEGVLFARIVAQNPEVAEMLRNRSSELQAMLRRIGLKVDEVHVNVSGGNGWNFGENLGARSEQGRAAGERVEVASSGAEESLEGQSASMAPQKQEAPLDHWVA